MTSNLKVVGQKVLASMTMVVTVLSLSGLAVLTPTAAALAVAPADYGLHEGDVIRATGDIDIYIINDWGYKRLFVNPAIFNLYGHLSFSNVHEVSPATRDAFGTSGLFRNCESGDQKVYGLEVVSEDVANLHWVNVSGADAVSTDPNFFKKVFCINNAEQGLYGTGAVYTSLGQIPDYTRGGPNPSATPGPGTTLRGGAGNLESADYVSSLNNEEVGEGENNVPVLGLTLSADNGSDLRVISARVVFDGSTNGDSTKLADYADEVQVWMGSTKVATVDAADFNKDSTGVYSKSVSLTGDGVIPMDGDATFKVSVSAIDNFDSQDIGSANWNVAVESLRYVDAEGAITTEDNLDGIGGTPRDVDFVDFQTASDLELKLSEATSTNPDDASVEVDKEDGKDHVLLASGNFKASDSDFTVSEMRASVSFSGVLADQVSDFTLEIDGNEVDSVDAATVVGGNIKFDDIDDYEISEGDTVTVKLYADVNGTDDAGQGETLQATIRNSATVADDQNGDSVDASDLPGTVVGGIETFFSEGVMAEVTSIEEVVTTSTGNPDTGTYTFKFKVTSFGSDAYVVSSASCNGISYSINGPGSDSGCNLDSTADESPSDHWLVNDGDSESFTVTIAVQGGDGFSSVHLNGINYTTDTTSDTLDLSNLNEWESDSKFLNN